MTERGLGVRQIGRVMLAGLCGALIVWAIAAVVLYTIFANGGYKEESLVELPPWSFGVIGLCGASLGVALTVIAGRQPLPWWMRPIMVGGLTGVATAVLPAAAIACPSQKGHPIQDVALFYGVPGGFVIGGIVAMLRAIHCRAGRGAAADRGNVDGLPG